MQLMPRLQLVGDLAGRLVDGLVRGRPRWGWLRPPAAGERLMEELLSADLQASGHLAMGWTVSLRAGELWAAGYALGERTVSWALLGENWSSAPVSASPDLVVARDLLGPPTRR